MKTKKRFLSILLSLALVLGLMPGMSLEALAETNWSGTVAGGALESGTYALSGNTILSTNITIGNDKNVVLNLGEYTLTGQSDSSIITVNGGTLKIQGTTGSITGANHNNPGGGVYISGNGTVTLEGGKIANNKAHSGAGVYIYYGTFKMTGGEISGNETDGRYSAIGGGIGTTSDVGGGGQGEKTTIVLTGGKITGNKSNGGEHGGGVSARGNADLTVGGTVQIIHNTAGGLGGGIFTDNSHNKVKVYGSPVIKDNNSGNITKNFCLEGLWNGSYTGENRKLTIVEPGLTADADIHVSMWQGGSYTDTCFTNNWKDQSALAGVDPETIFTSDDTDYSIYVHSDGELHIKNKSAVISGMGTVVFDFQGYGTNILKTLSNGTSLTLPESSDSPPAGKKLSGWAYNGNTYEPGAQITVQGNATYTAQWVDKIVLSDDQKPTAKTNLVYTGSAQELVNKPAKKLPEGAKEMQYALGTDDTNAPTDGWGTSIPTGTEAGTYYVWYKVIGDENHYDTEPECIAVKIDTGIYSTVSVTNGEHTIGDGKDTVLTVKGEPDDNTYENFTGADMDGNAISDSNYTKAKGSLILTLKASYLDTLTTGDHKVTINFKDGAATAILKVNAAAPTPTPKPLPKTGDSGNPLLWLLIALLGVSLLGITVKKNARK